MFADPLDAFAESSGCPDAIAEEVKRKAKAQKYRQKPVSRWTYADFLRCLDSLLALYDISYERQGAQSDGLSVGRIYDRLADHFKSDMSNYVLKSYFEWWTNIYAQRMHDKPVYVQRLLDERVISQYMNRCAGPLLMMMPGEPEFPRILDDEDLDDNTLFEAGGLPLLIINRGIVAGYRMLKSDSNVLDQISAVLRSLNKDVLDQVMRITIQRSPYPSDDKVDFISLARPCLEAHNLQEYTKFQYQEFFGPSQ